MTDPKPFTVKEVKDLWPGEGGLRLLATVQAAAEADSLRAQLEEAQRQLTEGRRLTEKLIGERDEALGVRDAAIDVQNRLHIAREKDEAALTAAQGEVAVLREALEKYGCEDQQRGAAAGGHEGGPCTVETPMDLCWVCAALASTRATADAHDERVRREALEDVKKFIMGGSFLHDAAPAKQFAREVCAGIDRALAHPTKEPNP